MSFFSIIMPLYNKAPYVRKAIESVVGQTFNDWELVVVDDGSTDESASIVEGIDDSRIRLVQQQNAGVSAARNRGVSLSSAPYLCFLDADDWWEPTFLEEMVGLMERHPDAGIYGTGYYIVKNGRKRVAPVGVDDSFVEGEINYCQVYAKTLCMPLTSITVAIPRQVFEELGGFPEGIKLGEDFLLWSHIALKHKVVLLNRPLANYNQDVDSSFRGTHKHCYDPNSFVTFHFDQFEKEESYNKDLKVLLDRLRVYSLMSFRKNNLYPELVSQEIKKVDFRNVAPLYNFYYNYPFWMVKTHLVIHQFLSYIKHLLLK